MNFLFAIAAIPPKEVGFYTLRVGVIDQPAQPWPAQTDAQKMPIDIFPEMAISHLL